MRLQKFSLGLISLIACQTSLFAIEDNLERLLDMTKKSYEQQHFIEAYDTIVEASMYIFEKMPLKLANFSLVEKPAEGFGIYTLKDTNVYKAEEPIYIYCEPRGYVFKKNGNQFHFGLTTDFTVTDQDGNVLGGQNDFGKFEFISYQPSMEFLLNLTYSLSGLEAGTYQIHTTAKDPNSSKQTTETIEIKIEK